VGFFFNREEEREYISNSSHEGVKTPVDKQPTEGSQK
jgi:hypothetical protein